MCQTSRRVLAQPGGAAPALPRGAVYLPRDMRCSLCGAPAVHLPEPSYWELHARACRCTVGLKPPSQQCPESSAVGIGPLKAAREEARCPGRALFYGLRRCSCVWLTILIISMDASSASWPHNLLSGSGLTADCAAKTFIKHPWENQWGQPMPKQRLKPQESARPGASATLSAAHPAACSPKLLPARLPMRHVDSVHLPPRRKSWPAPRPTGSGACRRWRRAPPSGTARRGRVPRRAPRGRASWLRSWRRTCSGPRPRVLPAWPRQQRARASSLRACARQPPS